MCSFGFTNRAFEDLEYINEFSKLRGPDRTNRVEHDGYSFFHNLLSITGERTSEPFVDRENGLYCVYNGEIYNHSDFGSFESDGECLLSAYREYGVEFCKKLDGEFAIVLVDFPNNLLVVTTDAFATKPVWTSNSEREVGVASYESTLLRLGFERPSKVPANTTLLIRLQQLELIEERSVVDFDLNQHKGGFEDWNDAFRRSIQKRSRDLREDIFVGLSSGYDSGAIACELTRQGTTFIAYTVASHENRRILSERHELVEQNPIIHLKASEYDAEVAHLFAKAEAFTVGDYDIRKDPGAAGLSYICRRARADGYKIYFSGQGADEIISDYGRNGVKLWPVSEFGGRFPEDLSEIFPYRNFYGGTQLLWLNKEECVAGSHGIETRYPYLDVRLVQEFLWLRAELKNEAYKAPIAAYLTERGFPFQPDIKLGFAADAKLDRSEVDSVR